MTGDEPQGIMGRVLTVGPLCPSRLPLRAHFHREGDVWVRGSLLEVSPEWKLGWGLLINNQQIKYISFILPRNLLQSLFQATS